MSGRWNAFAANLFDFFVGQLINLAAEIMARLEVVDFAMVNLDREDVSEVSRVG
jgi:hypothetical protein